MKITNLTSKVQKVKVKEITGDREEYEIYIQPHGSTEVSRVSIQELDKLKGIIEVATPFKSPITQPEVSEEPNTVVEEKSEIVEEVEPEKDSEPEYEDKFVCDICGAEFASSRGLASHKSRAHADM